VEQISRIGMDSSKHVFQLRGVNAAESPVLRKKLRRKEMVAFFEKLAPTIIAIEACGAGHQLARLLRSLGHTVKLIAPQLVNPTSSGPCRVDKGTPLKPHQGVNPFLRLPFRIEVRAMENSIVVELRFDGEAMGSVMIYVIPVHAIKLNMCVTDSQPAD
jgi:hypothetical protein